MKGVKTAHIGARNRMYIIQHSFYPVNSKQDRYGKYKKYLFALWIEEKEYAIKLNSNIL